MVKKSQAGPHEVVGLELGVLNGVRCPEYQGLMGEGVEKVVVEGTTSK